MNKQNPNHSMHYELGVLLYNLKNQMQGTFPSEYNAEENFLSLISGIETATNQPFNFENLKDGYVSESQNYQVDSETVLNDFNQITDKFKEDWTPFTPVEKKIFILMHYTHEMGVVLQSFWKVEDAVEEAFKLQEAAKHVEKLKNSVFTIVTSLIK